MEFIETPIFTKRVQELLSDEDYQALQGVLAANPLAGDVIPGTGGLRKIRWRSSAGMSGKRSGVRVIYYRISGVMLYMAHIYDKRKHGDLSAGELRALSALVRETIK